MKNTNSVALLPHLAPLLGRGGGGREGRGCGKRDSAICITAKGQSMGEGGPLLGNCQRRQGAASPKPLRVKSAYLGCHLDMTGPQGRGRGVKLLTTFKCHPGAASPRGDVHGGRDLANLWPRFGLVVSESHVQEKILGHSSVITRRSQRASFHVMTQFRRLNQPLRLSPSR